ncbi:MAG TPA: LCP family protein [Candidatus Limnocylindrales bacterium]|nr:LCP family protein [Candidatus Limnocylindrales bacterium]
MSGREQQPPKPPSPRRLTAAGVADLVIPGLGHAFVGRPRAALLFFVPVALAIAGLLVLYLSGGFTAVLAWVVTPGVLPLLAAANIAFGVWRIAAGLDAARGTTRPRLAFAVLIPVAFLFVLVPHLWLGSTIAATSDYLDSTFASGPEVSEEPDDTPPPGWTYAPDPVESDAPSFSLDPSFTPGPTGTPRPPMTSGTGNLPALNVSVPWQRPGAVPWGNDGRFDLLLLGSDAGPDRWSRRMDVMLLVEIDVATGKVAMIGLPRNLLNAPFPAGPARDAVACGCFKDLLNALYVEATIRHPDRWPGTGATAGIGAVRSVVSEITGRPVDAVVVADLWGMIKVVDAMGGIDINVPSSVYDAKYPDPVYGKIELYIKAGKQHFDGRMALAYARSRHQDSDYGRMARQQTLLLAVRDQIGPKTILNAPDLFNAAKGFTWTDLPRDSLPNLVTLFGKAANASVKHLRIVPPNYPEYLTASELTKIRTAVAALLGLPAPPTPSPSPSTAPSPSGGATPGPASPGPTPAPTQTPVPPPSDTPPPTETPAPPTETSAPT